MTANDATTYLKYANLQLAAEAIDLKNGLTSKNLSDVLKKGNDRTSKFTNTSADDFASKWQVVATQDNTNTNTGFSGTLFVCIADDPALGYKAGEQVISFRSTEFADDAVRDNKATNMLEIQATGWAFGQIDDMKKWVDGLYASGKISPANSLDVTGYSLGGHLATAFNLLYPGAVRNTYTFNGAGVGVVNPGTSLTQVIAQFDRQRVNADGKQIVFSDADANLILQQLRAKLTGGVAPTNADIALAGSLVTNDNERNLLVEALTRINLVLDEVTRVSHIANGDSPPIQIAATKIDATKLDYQLAVLIAAQQTSSVNSSIPAGGWAAISSRNIAPGGPIAGFYDIFGANLPSAVSNSQLHYGQSTPVFIEDQPLYRGAILSRTLENKLLDDDFAHNDFGDTHSLVLLVDSLTVQNTLAQLDSQIDTSITNAIFQSASKLEAIHNYGTQGQAEGDVLETVLDGLRRILQGPSITSTPFKTEGGTWFDIDDRNTFYNNLKALTDSAAFIALKGKVTVTASGTASALASQARDDFAPLATLLALSPVALKSNDPAVTAALAAAWGDQYANWLADKDAIARGDEHSTLNFTDTYLADRANMLGRINEGNNNNTGYGEIRTGTNWQFVDKASGKAAYAFSTLDAIVNADGKQIVFSDADANLILQQLRAKLTSRINDDAWRMAA
jgi:hypothetical protein